MKVAVKSITKLVVLTALLTSFSGCKWITDLFKKKPVVEKEVVEVEVEKEDAEAKIKDEVKGKVLLKIDGKAVLGEQDFNKHLAQMLQMNPYFRGAGADSLPMAIKRKFFDELVKQELIIAWAEKNDIDQDAEFIKSYNDMKKLVRRSLLVQRYEAKIFEKIKISDSQVKDYYNKNKDKFVKEQGGVSLSGVKFDDADAAFEFYDEVKGKKNKFASLAQDSEGEYSDFGRVVKDQPSMSSMRDGDVPAALKNKAFGLKNVPAVEKVKVGKNTWVIYVADKKEAEYFGIDEIRPQVEAMLKNNQFKDAIDKQVKGLEKEFTMDKDEDYFKEAKKESKFQLPKGVKIKTAEEVKKEKAARKMAKSKKAKASTIKTATKKTAARKTGAKKVAARKTGAVAKKIAERKIAARKTVAKKIATKKVATKKTARTAKRSTKKNSAVA